MRTLNQSSDSRGWDAGLYPILESMDDVVKGGGERRTDERFLRSYPSVNVAETVATRERRRGSFLLSDLFSVTSPKMKNLRNAVRMRITESWPNYGLAPTLP